MTHSRSPLRVCVRRQDAAPVDYGSVIEAAIFVVEITPVAGQMPYENSLGRLSGILEGFEGTRRGDDPTWGELGFVVSFMTHVVAPVWDLWLFTV